MIILIYIIGYVAVISMLDQVFCVPKRNKGDEVIQSLGYSITSKKDLTPKA